MNLLYVLLLCVVFPLSATSFARAEATAAYLLVHFTGESPRGEQIYFAVSEDGLRWDDLNNSEPVLLSDIGEKGVRDPSIIRLSNGKFVILATDLRIAAGKGWGTAMTGGSTSLIMWESDDLVRWSKPWMADVASTIPGAGCAWAPEAIRDDQAGGYFLYWATISEREGKREARIYYARTKDFRTFTKPELYIERSGRAIIDTQIIEVPGGRHRYFRVSCDGEVTFEVGDKLLGEWERIGDLSPVGFTGKQVEGPILFKFNAEQKWGLLMDQYSSGRGYLPFVSADLAGPAAGFSVVPTSSYNLGISHKRHGGVLPITRTEYEALKAQWPSQPIVRLAPFASRGRFLRHADFRLRLDADVNPAADGLWRLVPSVGAGSDTVSIRSVNFPDHYVTATASNVAMERGDGSEAFTRRATFTRVPGLSHPDGASFRVDGSPNLYLRTNEKGIEIGPAVTAPERVAATFFLQRQ